MQFYILIHFPKIYIYLNRAMHNINAQTFVNMCVLFRVRIFFVYVILPKCTTYERCISVVVCKCVFAQRIYGFVTPFATFVLHMEWMRFS